MDFNTPVNRRSSDSLKWTKYAEDVLPLWVADTDFPPPPEVLAAIQSRLDHGIFGYAKPQDQAKQAICSWLGKQHSWSILPEQIVLLPGVVPGFNLAALAFTNPGDGVLIQTPAYHPFFEVAQNAGLVQQTQQLAQQANGRYLVDLDDFKRSLTPRTRLFLLCNPQNPTGRVFSRSELTEMAEACLAQEVLICSDEIHSDLLYEPHQHLPIATLSEEISARTITLISPSKTFNLAGLESAAAIITDPSLRKKFQSKLKGLVGSINLIGAAALAAAYSEGSSYLKELLRYLTSNRQFLVDFVSRDLPGIRISPPDGTYLAWLDCTGAGLDNPADHFLNHAKVALNEGSWFGPPYQQFVRLNFGCSRDTLSAALDRMRKSLV